MNVLRFNSPRGVLERIYERQQKHFVNLKKFKIKLSLPIPSTQNLFPRLFWVFDQRGNVDQTARRLWVRDCSMQCCAAVGALGATCRKQQRGGGEGIGVWIVLLSVINPLSARTMSQRCCRRLHCSSKRERNKRMIDNFVCLWSLSTEELVPMRAWWRFGLWKLASARQVQLTLCGMERVMVKKGSQWRKWLASDSSKLHLTLYVFNPLLPRNEEHNEVLELSFNLPYELLMK